MNTWLNISRYIKCQYLSSHRTDITKVNNDKWHTCAYILGQPSFLKLVQVQPLGWVRQTVPVELEVSKFSVKIFHFREMGGGMNFVHIWYSLIWTWSHNAGNFRNTILFPLTRMRSYVNYTVFILNAEMNLLPPPNEVCEGYVFTGNGLSRGFCSWGGSCLSAC